MAMPQSCISSPEIYAPEQIHALYRALPLPESEILELHQYFEAASHLYGIIRLKHLLHIYNCQNPPVSDADFLAVAEIIRHEANDFYILDKADLYESAPATAPMDREIVSLAVLAFGTERYDRLIRLQVGSPLPIPAREELLAYRDPRHFPSTPQHLNMLDFLRNRADRLPGSARDMLRTVQTMIWLGCDLQEVLCGLSAAGFSFRSHAEQREFTVLFHAMERHTRTIANRGQTPAASISHSSLFFSAHRKLFAKLKGAAAVSRMFML